MILQRVWCIACILNLLLFSSCTEEVRVPVPVKNLDGRAAYTILEQHLSHGPRYSNSPAALKSIEDIRTITEKIGWQFKVDKWREVSHGQQMTFRNVEVTRPGKGDKFIIIAGHYDTKNLPNFSSANDGGSSTAVIMQMMKEIAAENKTWDNTCEIRFVFFDGEECQRDYDKISIHDHGGDGLWGSKRYARQLYESGQHKKCKALILLDMIGDKELNLEIPTNCNPVVSDIALRLADNLGYGKYIKNGNRRIVDDFVPFEEISIPTIDLIDFNYGPNNSFWHTEQDSLDKISHISLEISGTIAKYLLWQLGSQDK